MLLTAGPPQSGRMKAIAILMDLLQMAMWKRIAICNLTEDSEKT